MNKSGTIVRAYWKRKSETEWKEIDYRNLDSKEIK